MKKLTFKIIVRYFILVNVFPLCVALMVAPVGWNEFIEGYLYGWAFVFLFGLIALTLKVLGWSYKN